MNCHALGKSTQLLRQIPVRDWGGCLQGAGSRSCAHILAAGQAGEGRLMASSASGMGDKLCFVRW